MTKPPAFQFYAQDWLSSIDISLMTLVEEGAYHRLLCWAWTQDDCGLPSDDEALAKLSRLEAEWLHSKDKILKKFRLDKGRLFNDRLLTERRKQEAWRAKCSKGGKTRAINAIRKGSSGLVQGLLKGSSSLQSSSSKLSSNGGVSTDQVNATPSPQSPPLEIQHWYKSVLVEFPGSRNIDGEPDSQIVEQCIAITQGKREKMREALEELHRRRKAPSRSWAWFPKMLATCGGVHVRKV